MDKLKIGIAGYGKMGQIREKTIQDSNMTQVTAIYDVEDHEHSDNTIKLCDSYQELL
jgi:glyceraldehyde-3-phosphate dehydrogenase/erythrose-4-phosphate dehydrogenase